MQKKAQWGCCRSSAANLQRLRNLHASVHVGWEYASAGLEKFESLPDPRAASNLRLHNGRVLSASSLASANARREPLQVGTEAARWRSSNRHGRTKNCDSHSANTVNISLRKPSKQRDSNVR